MLYQLSYSRSGGDIVIWWPTGSRDFGKSIDDDAGGSVIILLTYVVRRTNSECMIARASFGPGMGPIRLSSNTASDVRV